MKKFFVSARDRVMYALAVCCLALSGAYAQEGSTTENIDLTAAGDTLKNWVDSTKTELDKWVDYLVPLFGAGIILVLVMVAWKLFKRVTNRAS